MMKPAQTIIAKLGGVLAVARLVGIHRTRVSSWRLPKSQGGTDGTIPQRHHRTLLDHARSRCLDLKAEEFLPPRKPQRGRRKPGGANQHQRAA